MQKGQSHPSAIRSRDLIVMSLFELMKTEAYEKITIKEITDKAQLTRRTFYAHFKSKEDILSYQLRRLNEELLLTIKTQDSPTHNWIAQTYFQFWMRHVDLLTSLKNNQLLLLLFDTFESQVAELRSIFCCQYSEISPAYEYYSSAYFTGILWNMLDKWIANGTRETPEELIKILSEITLRFSSVFARS